MPFLVLLLSFYDWFVCLNGHFGAISRLMLAFSFYFALSCKDKEGYQHRRCYRGCVILLGLVWFTPESAIKEPHGLPNPALVWTNESKCSLCSVTAQLKLHVLSLVQTRVGFGNPCGSRM